MYDDLRKVLAETHSIVNWYSMGEAIKLADAILKVVNYHRANPQEEKARSSLKRTAEQTADFLRRVGHNNKSAEILKELQRILTEIELEM